MPMPNQSLQRTAGARPGWQSEHLARLSLSLGRSQKNNTPALHFPLFSSILFPQ